MKSVLCRLMLIALGTFGCGTGTVFPIPPLHGTPSLPPAPGIRVGTARVDVTPPPGPSTWGHGPDALAAQGYWTRLQCRVFVIEASAGSDPQGQLVRERYAIVPCDLPAISYALFREVAHRVEGVVAGDHILLTATHTHAGPGHYFEAGVYSGVLSSRRPGFDNKMLGMLSARIGRGILEAAARTVPAELGWGSTVVLGMTRNRSLQAFAMNGSPLLGPKGAELCPVAARLPGLSPQDKERLKTGLCENLGAACEAIDPSFSTLSIREFPSQKPLGSISFFAMHPTVLPAHTRLFGGDVFAIASRELEHRMRSAWATEHPSSSDSDPLAALVNTNEGDIVPVWSVGDLAEARQIGVHLASEGWRAHTEQQSPVATIATAFVEANMTEANAFLHGDKRRAAELGQGSSHGGSDHATSIDDILAPQPDWQSGSGPQDPKTPLLGFLNRQLAADDGLPALMPFSLWRVGDRWLAAVPAELTVTSGFRVRNAVRATTHADLSHVIIAGLANSYMQYVATCEEFHLQHYEGASTLYGSQTESFIAKVAGNLGCRLSQATSAPCAVAMPPGIQARPFQAFDVKPDANRSGERYPASLGKRQAQLQGVCQLPKREPNLRAPELCVRWLDASPGDIPLAAPMSSPGPWLSVSRRGEAATVSWDPQDPRSFLDDRGDDFQVRARAECGDDTFGYSAIIEFKEREWAAIAPLPAVPGKPRFSVRARSPGAPGRPLLVDFDETTQACSRDEVLYCLNQYDPATPPIPMACGKPN